MNQQYLINKKTRKVIHQIENIVNEDRDTFTYEYLVPLSNNEVAFTDEHEVVNKNDKKYKINTKTVPKDKFEIVHR